MKAYFFEHWQYLTKPAEYQGLDLLRSLAVVLVILYHFSILPWGWIGVDLFFVISGFLIGGIILDKIQAGEFNFSDFYWRRALRILPVYYFILFSCLLLKSNSPIDGISLQSTLSGALFLHTFIPYFWPEFLVIKQDVLVGGSWSLVVEEFFYLLAPLILTTIYKLTRKNLLLILFFLVILFVLGVEIRLFMTRNFEPNDPNWHFASFVQFHSRYDEIVLGVAAAVYVRIFSHRSKNFDHYCLVVFSALFWLFVSYIYGKPEFLARPYLITRDTIWLPTLLGLISTFLLLALYKYKFSFEPIILISRLSYVLYLSHILFFIELVNSYGDRGLIFLLKSTFSLQGRAVILITMSVIFSYILSLCIEYPFVRLYKNK